MRATVAIAENSCYLIATCVRAVHEQSRDIVGIAKVLLQIGFFGAIDHLPALTTPRCEQSRDIVGIAKVLFQIGNFGAIHHMQHSRRRVFGGVVSRISISAHHGVPMRSSMRIPTGTDTIIELYARCNSTGRRFKWYLPPGGSSSACCRRELVKAVLLHSP